MHDVAILGSGFAGSLLAMILRRLGRTVLLVERHRHPRFAIGESSTPLADLLWLELTQRYDLPFLAPFAKWGTWLRAHPEISCGLKRGFAFYHHPPGQPFANRADRSDQLLVAASPHDEIADTHWYRPEFDTHLVSEAVRLGVDYRDQCELGALTRTAHGFELELRRANSRTTAEAAFVVDAGSRAGMLAHRLGLEVSPLSTMPPTQALFTHFRDVRKLSDLPLHAGLAEAPFPVDDAAVHHVFDGGWIWVLRFRNGLTSAGVAATDSRAAQLGLSDGAAAWERLLDHLPSVRRQFEPATPTHPFVHTPQLGFRVAPAAGPGWALLPSAAAFVDPMLSSGFTLSLLGIERLAQAFAHATSDPQRSPAPAALEDYARQTAADAEALEDFLAALYARFTDFDAFTEIARLYFGVVIHGETTRRLGNGGAHGYLLRNHSLLAPRIRACTAAARHGGSASELRLQVDAVLAEIDVAGLLDATRRPWYPVRADDLRLHRDRVEASADDVEALLRRAGFPR